VENIGTGWGISTLMISEEVVEGLARKAIFVRRVQISAGLRLRPQHWLMYETSA